MTSTVEREAMSIADTVAMLDDAYLEAWIDGLADDLLAEVARKEWWYVARPNQVQPEGDWAIWLILAGRGWGKTRTGSEWLIDRMLESPVDVDGYPTEWAAIAQTYQDGKKIMIEGPSGLRNVLYRRGIRFTYHRWPTPVIRLATGQLIHVLGEAGEDTARGYNLAGAWLDEIAKWPDPYAAWTEGIGPSLRTRTPNNAKPRVIATTTPKPIPLLFDWTRRDDGSVHITRGSTFDNARNLSDAAVEEFVRLYGNSRVGRQELYAELLEDVEGALWHLRWIEHMRLDPARKGFEWPEFDLKVVAVDPAVSVTETSDETGLVAVARGAGDGYEYVIGDRSGKFAGRTAAVKAWKMWRELDCDLLVYEDNQGMDWVRDVLVDQWEQLQAADPEWPPGDPPLEAVHAKRGKRLRAEPIANRYENQRVRHIGVYPKMESQMVEWIPDQGKDSPDRLDALVHGLTRLRKGVTTATVASPNNVAGQPGNLPPGLAEEVARQVAIAEGLAPSETESADQQRLTKLAQARQAQPGRIRR